MISKVVTKYLLLLCLLIGPVCMVYFVFQAVNQLSFILISMNDELISQQNSEKRHYLDQIVSLIEIDQKELEQEIRANLINGELGDLIHNSKYDGSYSLHLESWLKAFTDKIDLEQVIIFSDRGVILAGYSNKPFLGASGLVDGGNIAFSYRPLIENAFISRGITFYDQFPDSGYNKSNLSIAMLLPLRDSSQKIIAGLGVTRKINPDILFSNYRKVMGESAPKPFLVTDLNSEKIHEALTHAIINHHGEKIAYIGLDKNITLPNTIKTTLLIAEQVNKLCKNSFIFLLIISFLVLLGGITEVIHRFRGKSDYTNYQDVRTLFQQSRQKALDNMFYFS